MDLTITIQPNGRHTTKTFQKLWIYISSTSLLILPICLECVKGLFIAATTKQLPPKCRKVRLSQDGSASVSAICCCGMGGKKIKSMILAVNQWLWELKNQPLKPQAGKPVRIFWESLHIEELPHFFLSSYSTADTASWGQAGNFWNPNPKGFATTLIPKGFATTLSCAA